MLRTASEILLIIILCMSWVGCPEDEEEETTNNDSLPDQDDVAIDAQDDVAQTDADEGEAGQDVEQDSIEEDQQTDAVSDVVEDVDDGDEGSADMVVDLVDSVEDPRSDPVSDVSHFEFCPYEEPAGEFDCVAVCGDVVTCGGDLDSCVEGCSASLLIMSSSVMADVAECIETTDCDSVPEDGTLNGYCFEQTISALEANEEVIATCESVDATATSCAGEPTGFEQMCLFLLPSLRAEALTTFDACAEVECAIFDECVHDALCGLFF